MDKCTEEAKHVKCLFRSRDIYKDCATATDNIANFIRCNPDLAMLKIFLFFVISVSSIGHSIAQTNETVRIKSGDDPAKSYSPFGFYQFPVFSEGVAVFKNGGQTTARFNYHMLNEEMQFISANGDTLALADPFSIKYVKMDSNTFYYSNGYLQIIVNNESLMLARRLHLNTKWEKIGAYGQPSPSGSIRTPNKLILVNTGKNLSINQDILIRKEYDYYWLDKYGTALRATKGNLFKLLSPDQKNDIEDYLKKSKIDFNKEADLKKLLHYSLGVK